MGSFTDTLEGGSVKSVEINPQRTLKTPSPVCSLSGLPGRNTDSSSSIGDSLPTPEYTPYRFVIIQIQPIPFILSIFRLNTPEALDEVKEAKALFGLSGSYSFKNLMDSFKSKALQCHQSIAQLNEPMLILLKQKCESLSPMDLLSDPDQLYNSLIRGSVWEENEQKVTLQLSQFDSFCHKKFFNAAQKVLKAKGPRAMTNKFQIKSQLIKFPFSRTKHEFPPIMMVGESMSINMLEISVAGDSAMIFVGFILQSILKTFLKSIEGVQQGNVDWSDDLPRPQNKETEKREYISDDDKISQETVMIENVTDDENEALIMDELPSESLLGFQKRLKREEAVPHSMTTPKKIAKQNQEVIIPKIITECFVCALLDISENVDKLLMTEQVNFALDCSLKCVNTVDCLDSLVQGISALIMSQKIDEHQIKTMKRNIESVFVSVLDKSPFLRGELFCQILESLSILPVLKQHRMMNLLRELCDLFVGDDPKSLEVILNRNKSSRRNIMQFLATNGKFFSLQSTLEMFDIMRRKGIHLEHILPSSMITLVQQLDSAPDTRSSEYFFFMADMTRQLLTDVLKSRNTIFIEAKKIEFHSGSTVLEKSFDSHIYFNIVEKTLHHFLWDGSVVCEEIKFSKLNYEENHKLLRTKHWNFILPDHLNVQLRKLLLESNTAENKGYFEELDDKEEPSIPAASTESEKHKTDEKTDVPCTFESGFANKEGRNDSGGEDIIETKNDDGQEHKIETRFIVKKDDILFYWVPNKRKFSRPLAGRDWPRSYRSPCPVIFTYSHAKIVDSSKRITHFAKLRGSCKICKSIHELFIEESPFVENASRDGNVQYSVMSDMIVKVFVIGRFELDAHNRPDISAPKHNLEKATGLFLKGRERECIGEKSSRLGVQNVFMEQFDNLDEEQMKHGNKTSIKSYDVIKMARLEHEKKQRCGDTFFESVENIIDSQHLDISLNFKETKASRELPGFVRSAQKTPFKIFMANYDQLHVAGNYLNNTKNSIIFMDSSGKLLKKEKGKSKLLNTAVVIPPPARGHSPFPIFEMVSEQNKTIDFQTFLEYGLSYISTAMNNAKICNPSIAVSDFSFANIHSLLAVFNKVKIEEYLKKLYKCSLKNEPFPYETVLSICENHFLPSFLQFARNMHSDKAVADTVVAGILKVIEADSIEAALKVFKTLVDIHCSPEICKEARERVKEVNFDDFQEIISDFGDDATEEEEMNYGNRKGLRRNSPYFHLFRKLLETKLDENEGTSITNRFYAPKLMMGMARQYLSLFPLFSASLLPDKTLKTNSYIELYWKDQRRILQDVPDRLRWPPRYLGNLHTKIRRDAKSIISHGIIPNLKHGGKAKPGMTEAFKAYCEKTLKKDLFIPQKQKKTKTNLNPNESFGGTSEMWDSQKSKDAIRRKDNYIKGKRIDYDAIVESSEMPVETITVTGSRMSLENTSEKSQLAESITLQSDEIRRLLTKNSYIASEVVDSGLILLDKRFNEDSKMRDTLFVYTIQNLRLILNGVTNLINRGKFITVLPRDFGMEVEEDRFKAFQAGAIAPEPGSHYTLVSNLHCKEGEVNVYETFGPYRCPQFLLKESTLKLIKMLTQSKSLKINCMAVQEQTESECGAISIGLAIQLCFYPAEEGAIHYQLNCLRTELFRCLKENQLSYFNYSKLKSAPQGKVLFTMDC